MTSQFLHSDLSTILQWISRHLVKEKFCSPLGFEKMENIVGPGFPPFVFMVKFRCRNNVDDWPLDVSFDLTDSLSYCSNFRSRSTSIKLNQ